MKAPYIFLILLFSCLLPSMHAAAAPTMPMMHQTARDSRTPLGLPPMMRTHQLSNMRSHLQAVQTIVGLIAEGDFDQAAEVAHDKLGLTEEMRRMCNMFTNPEFRKLGLAFHRSADELAEVLKTRDVTRSLQALHKTMNYCVQCHAAFRQ